MNPPVVDAADGLAPAAGQPPAGSSAPVAVRISRRIRPGCEAAFERLVDRTGEAASRFDGFLGLELARPSPPGHSEHIVELRFSDRASLAKWQDGATFRRLLAEADGLTESKTVRYRSGLEAWFALPADDGAAAQPPRWKTAVVSALAIYPIINVVPRLLAPVTAELPQWAASLVTVVLLTPLLTYVVMPAMTRLFSSWLYPAGGSGTAGG